jgi:rRNA maturation protein Rpf1
VVSARSYVFLEFRILSESETCTRALTFEIFFLFSQACRKNDVTDLVLVHEHRGEPDGLVISLYVKKTIEN